MPDSMTILLVEDDKQQRNKLAAILEFVAQEPITIIDYQAASDKLDDGVEAIILGGCSSAEARKVTFDALRKASENIPILVLVAENGERDLDKDMVKHAFSLINLPMRYAEVSDALHRAQVYRLSQKRDRKSVV